MPRELLVTGPGEFAIQEYAEPELGARQVRIKTEFAAPKHGTESHTFQPDPGTENRAYNYDYHMFLPAKSSGPSFPRPVGNMAVGKVTEVGAGVTRFKPGDRVYGHLKIRETQTVHELGPSEGVKRVPCGVREDGLHLVPKGMRPEQIVCLDPAHFALAAVRDANVRMGERVAVFGLGAIGLMIVQMAVRSGATQVFAVDPLANRRAVAHAFGATAGFDPTTGQTAKQIKDATGGAGVDVALDASGSYAALQEAIRSTHYSGLVVTVSFYHGTGGALRLGDEWHLTRVTVKSSMPVWGNPSRDHPTWDDERLELTVLDLVSSGALSVDGLIDPIVAFEQSPEALGLAVHSPDKCVKVGVRFD